MTKFSTSLLCLIYAAFWFCPIGARAQCEATLEPDWRIVRVQIAPWSPAAASRQTVHDWVGQHVTFKHDSVDGPGLLHCAHVILESTVYPTESLFQGNLPAPAGASAQALGISDYPVRGVTLKCDTGLFEFHRVEPEILLLGLDNLVLTLSRTAGALASADSPEGRTQRFLEAHFSGDMGFNLNNAKTHRAWFSAQLEAAISAYFAKPLLKNEVPAVDGDPFTDSQEYPQRFAVGEAQLAGDVAKVSVRFSDASNRHSVIYLLRKENGTWQLDDLLFANGKKLLELLE